MSLLNSPIQLHLSRVKVVHGLLVATRHPPDGADTEGGLLKPFYQLLKHFGLGRLVNITRPIHSFKLKRESVNAYFKYRQIKLPPEHED